MRDKRTRSVLPAQDGKVEHPSRSSPAERSLRARMAAHRMHAVHDARVTTAAGRAAFLARFEREVDPEGVLDPEERQRRAEHARKAYFAALSLRAAKARRRKRHQAVKREGGEKS